MMRMHVVAVLALVSVVCVPLAAQQRDTLLLLRPAAVWDGVNDAPHSGWTVLVRGDRIAAVGAAATVGSPPGATIIDLPGTTLLPGLIEGHSHLFLHPYNEAQWNDQVLKESLTLRTARATMHARATLMAGFTTVRDLGTEGAASLIYGKLSLVGKSILYYDMHLLGGMGATSTESGTYFTPHIGIGQQVFLNKNMSIKLDYRLMEYTELLLDKISVGPNAGKPILGNPYRVNWTHSIVIGVDFLFGIGGKQE